MALLRSDRGQQEADATFEFGGDLLERAVASGVADAPVRRARGALELRADLADAVAERDDDVEAPGRELVQVLRAAAADIDPALAHHPHRLGVQRLRAAARALGRHAAAGARLDQRLRHL